MLSDLTSVLRGFFGKENASSHTPSTPSKVGAVFARILSGKTATKTGHGFTEHVPGDSNSEVSRDPLSEATLVPRLRGQKFEHSDSRHTDTLAKESASEGRVDFETLKDLDPVGSAVFGMALSTIVSSNRPGSTQPHAPTALLTEETADTSSGDIANGRTDEFFETHRPLQSILGLDVETNAIFETQSDRAHSDPVSNPDGAPNLSLSSVRTRSNPTERAVSGIGNSSSLGSSVNRANLSLPETEVQTVGWGNTTGRQTSNSRVLGIVSRQPQADSMISGDNGDVKTSQSTTGSDETPSRSTSMPHRSLSPEQSSAVRTSVRSDWSSSSAQRDLLIPNSVPSKAISPGESSAQRPIELTTDFEQVALTKAPTEGLAVGTTRRAVEGIMSERSPSLDPNSHQQATMSGAGSRTGVSEAPVARQLDSPSVNAQTVTREPAVARKELSAHRHRIYAKFPDTLIRPAANTSAAAVGPDVSTVANSGQDDAIVTVAGVEHDGKATPISSTGRAASLAAAFRSVTTSQVLLERDAAGQRDSLPTAKTDSQLFEDTRSAPTKGAIAPAVSDRKTPEERMVPRPTEKSSTGSSLGEPAVARSADRGDTGSNTRAPMQAGALPTAAAARPGHGLPDGELQLATTYPAATDEQTLPPVDVRSTTSSTDAAGDLENEATSSETSRKTSSTRERDSSSTTRLTTDKTETPAEGARTNSRPTESLNDATKGQKIHSSDDTKGAQRPDASDDTTRAQRPDASAETATAQQTEVSDETPKEQQTAATDEAQKVRPLVVAGDTSVEAEAEPKRMRLSDNDETHSNSRPLREREPANRVRVADEAREPHPQVAREAGVEPLDTVSQIISEDQVLVDTEQPTDDNSVVPTPVPLSRDVADTNQSQTPRSTQGTTQPQQRKEAAPIDTNPIVSPSDDAAQELELVDETDIPRISNTESSISRAYDTAQQLAAIDPNRGRFDRTRRSLRTRNGEDPVDAIRSTRTAQKDQSEARTTNGETDSNSSTGDNGPSVAAVIGNSASDEFASTLLQDISQMLDDTLGSGDLTGRHGRADPVSSQTASLAGHKTGGSWQTTSSFLLRTRSALAPQAVRADAADESWRSVQMKLDEGDGFVTIRTKKEFGKTKLTLEFSDSAIRTAVEGQADRLRESLEMRYNTAVDLSFGADQQNSQNFEHHNASANRIDSNGSTNREDGPDSDRSDSIQPRIGAGETAAWIG